MYRDVEVVSLGDLPHAWQRRKKNTPLNIAELNQRIITVTTTRHDKNKNLHADNTEPHHLSLNLHQHKIERVATVQHTRDEAADDAYAPFAEQLESGARIAREEARWSGLHIAQTQTRGLFEDAPKGQL